MKGGGWVKCQRSPVILFIFVICYTTRALSGAAGAHSRAGAHPAVGAIPIVIRHFCPGNVGRSDQMTD